MPPCSPTGSDSPDSMDHVCGGPGLVGACDGELDVGSIVAALAQLLDVEERELAADLLPRVRELLDDGFLQQPLS